MGHEDRLLFVGIIELHPFFAGIRLDAKGKMLLGVNYDFQFSTNGIVSIVAILGKNCDSHHKPKLEDVLEQWKKSGYLVYRGCDTSTSYS